MEVHKFLTLNDTLILVSFAQKNPPWLVSFKQILAFSMTDIKEVKAVYENWFSQQSTRWHVSFGDEGFMLGIQECSMQPSCLLYALTKMEPSLKIWSLG